MSHRGSLTKSQKYTNFFQSAFGGLFTLVVVHAFGFAAHIGSTTPLKSISCYNKIAHTFSHAPLQHAGALAAHARRTMQVAASRRASARAQGFLVRTHIHV